MDKSIIQQWKYSTDLDKIYKNQNVEFIKVSNGLNVISKQNKSTPGALLLNVKVKSNTRYKISIVGKSSANAFIFVCGSVSRKRLCKQYVYLNKILERKSIEFVTGTLDTTIDCGICFTKPKINDSCLLQKITLYLKKIDTVNEIKESNSNVIPDNISVTENILINKNINQYNSQHRFYWSSIENNINFRTNYNVLIQNEPTQMCVINQQSNNTPGILQKVMVDPYKNYKLIVNGRCPQKNAKIIISDIRGSLFIEKDMYLPFENEPVEGIFNSGENTEIYIGVCFEENTPIGEIFYISSIELVLYNKKFAIDFSNKIKLNLSNTSPSNVGNIKDESPDCIHDESPDRIITNTNTNTKEQNNPVNIPKEIKLIENNIFNLISAINDMDIDLERTEKRILENLNKNTKKSD